jgi:16S rRNA (guanine966-N2)-methyltransferase
VVRTVNALTNRVRIIAGRWRGRRIHFPELEAVRPTPDRVRETVFNWLQAEIAGACCLDLFAGTGILSFEALSRGAELVICVERDKSAIAAIRHNAGILGAGGLETVHADAIEYLTHSQLRPVDIVFIDPPYGSQILGQVCQILDERAWLAPQALVYMERCAKGPVVTVPGNWQCLRSKRAGQVDYRLYRRL